jgi:hypothetical protein
MRVEGASSTEIADAGGVLANNIVSWDIFTWTPLGLGTNGTIKALIAYGDKLMVGVLSQVLQDAVLRVSLCGMVLPGHGPRRIGRRSQSAGGLDGPGGASGEEQLHQLLALTRGRFPGRPILLEASPERD